MLADAISAEGFKLWKNRTVWFWGFAFPSIVTLIIGLGGALFLHSQKLGAYMPINLAAQLESATASAGSPLTQLLVLIPAASLFGGEYRWETWRLLAPRNSRLNWLLAKMIVFAIGAVLTILALDAASLIGSLFQGMINHGQLAWSPEPRFAARLAGQFAVSWGQLMTVGALAALVGVVSRSIVAALIVPILVGAAQSILGGVAQADPEHLVPLRLLGLPGLAAEILHRGIEGLLASVPNGDVLFRESIATLALWTLAGFALAFAYFHRQDLSKE